jgi:hypothetical protein
MDVAIEFNPSAFKYGVIEKAIRQAVINVIYDDMWEENYGKNDGRRSGCP